jgi:DNA invertase Pin-like site-specific DNA recombinase
MCFIRAYLRASTDEQDAARARGQVEAFAAERGMQIASWYVENESGATLARPELSRLLADSHPGDVLLIEQVDRLSRLKLEDWQNLKAELAARKVRVVALDVPTSWMMAVKTVDDFMARMFSAITDMMLDMLAAIARKDYEDRRRRQMQGQAKAKEEGEQATRHPHRRHARRRHILQRYQSATGCSRATAARRLPVAGGGCSGARRNAPAATAPGGTSRQVPCSNRNFYCQSP